MNKKTIFIFAMLLGFLAVGSDLGGTNTLRNDGMIVLNKEDNAYDYYKSKLKSGKELLIDSIISYTKTFIGTPFKWGGEDVGGFDCSGLFHYVFDKFELNIPRTSKYQVQMGKSIYLSEVQKGDFLFFKGRNAKKNEVKHVSFVIGWENGSVVMIHSTHRGIVIDRLDEIEYYKERFLEARRIEVYNQNEEVFLRATNLYGGFLR